MNNLASLNYAEAIQIPEKIRNENTNNKRKKNNNKKKRKIFSQNIELIYAELCLFFLLAGAFTEFFLKSGFSVVLYIPAYFFGGYFAAKEAFQNIIKGKFEIDFLMIFAAVGSAILGKYSEGALLLFLFSLGHGMEHYALEKAKKQIKALSDLTPPTADVKRNGKTLTVPVEELKVNETVVVRPGSKIPVDGFVIMGESSVNQAPITGESVPVLKSPLGPNKNIGDFGNMEEKYKVFAGTINGDGLLEIKVAKVASDSTLARLIKMVNEAEKAQSPAQQLTKNIERFYVPAMLIFVLVLCFAFLLLNEAPSVSFYRAMRVLVGGSPCALAISTPSAVLSGIARAARERVLIKGGKPLEDLGSLDFIAFDKTGTLTEGLPSVQEIIKYDIEESRLLYILYSVESLTTHPIGKAIVSKCEGLMKEKISSLTELESLKDNILKSFKIKDNRNIPGKGVFALVNDEKVHIGNKILMEEAGYRLSEEMSKEIERFHSMGHTTMIMAVESKGIVALISLADRARKGAKESITSLKSAGISEIVMLSGDNQSVADKIGKELGITISRGGLLPEDKLSVINEMKESGFKIAMVGDGVNDAPAMAASNVGIAMGAAGSDVALETADVALLADNLDNLPFVIELSRKAKEIVKQNLIISLGMIAFLIPASLLGLTEMGATVILHEGSTIVVAFNALRLLVFKNKYK